MIQRLHRTVHTYSAGQEILSVYGTPKIQHCAHKSPTLQPILNPLNLFHIFKSEIRFNIIDT